jgi:type IV secretion system protein VirB3
VGLPVQRAGLASDVLFVGATRPALRFGVPYVALLVNGLATFELFLVTRDLATLLVSVPLHLVTVALCAGEPRFFELLRVRFVLRARAGAGARGPWRGVSYGPFGRDVAPLVVLAERRA